MKHRDWFKCIFGQTNISISISISIWVSLCRRFGNLELLCQSSNKARTLVTKLRKEFDERHRVDKLEGTCEGMTEGIGRQHRETAQRDSTEIQRS